jgi:tetratricopeptide (TPR) repeat protein
MSASFFVLLIAGSAQSDLEAATSLYKQGEFAASIGLLQSLTSSDAMKSDVLFARDVHLHLGFDFFALERMEDADKQWSQALDLDPDYVISPLSPPALRRAFAALKASHTIRPSLKHTPPAMLRVDEPVTLSFSASSVGRECALQLRHRVRGANAFHTTSLERLGSEWRTLAFLPDVSGARAVLEYYLEVTCRAQVIAHLRSAETPFALVLERQTKPPAPDPWFRKWWVWTIVGAGVVAVAGVTTAVVLTRPTTGSARVVFEF